MIYSFLTNATKNNRAIKTTVRAYVFSVSVSCIRIGALSNYLIIQLPHYPITSLSNYLIIKLPHYPISSLSNYLIIQLPHYPITSLSNYLIKTHLTVYILRYYLIGYNVIGIVVSAQVDGGAA